MHRYTRPARRVALLGISLAFVIGLASCGGGDAAATGTPAATAGSVVRSDDGSAELTVPADALPAGVKLSDIKVTKLSPADTGVTFLGGEPPISAYRLEPDGTKFTKPLSLTMTMASRGDVTIGAILLPSDASAPLALDTNTNLEDPAKTRVTIAIPHFSTLVTHTDGRLSMVLPDNVAVGDSFTAKATLNWSGNETFEMFHKPPPNAIWRSTSRQIQGDFSGSNVTPNEIKNAPPSASMGFSFSASGTFSCVKPGGASVTYKAALVDKRDVDPPYAGHTENQHDFSVSGRVTCGANQPPKVTQLKATLVAPVTTYTVTASDPDGDPLTYEWKMAGELCGSPKVPWTQSGPSVKWSHSDQLPDSCEHKGTDHAVITSVTVSDGRGGSVQCLINGSETQTIDKPQCR